MSIKADEISKIIREQIGSFAVAVDVAEVGTVVSLGDGIAPRARLSACDGGRDARIPARGVRHRA